MEAESLPSGLHMLRHHSLPDRREVASRVGASIPLADQVLARDLRREAFGSVYDAPQLVAPFDQHARASLRLPADYPLIRQLAATGTGLPSFERLSSMYR
jgi:hypothetical protein